ncbi:MAG: 50S ribosomal protein L22 [Candidatus Omnitrophota bacterium]
MLACAKARFIRGSASKIRLVLDLVRGMNAQEALNYLRFVDKRSTYYIRKVLGSAVANAKQKGLDVERLVISKITADEGPRWKRFRAVSFGRAAEILKRTSHITVELDLPQAKALSAVALGPDKNAKAKVPAKPKKKEKSHVAQPQKTKRAAHGKKALRPNKHLNVSF